MKSTSVFRVLTTVIPDMLKYRIIFGVIFAAILLGLFYCDDQLSSNWPGGMWVAPRGAVIALLLALVLPFGIREMQNLIASDKSTVDISMRVCVPACILCAFWPWIEQVAQTVINTHNHGMYPAWEWIGLKFKTVKPHYLVPTVLAAATVGAFVMYTRDKKIEGAMANAGATLLTIVYLGVLPGFFLPIVLSHGSWMLLAIVAIVKSADIGAYITGRLFGRHKLALWLSPGKTIEGFVGGLLFSAGVGAFVASYFQHFFWAHGVIAGLLLGAVGQLGDLLESLFKRDAGVKDSGSVPGFGGVLDLLDSPLLAAPVAYWLLKIIVGEPV